jgi:hypothetical protein
MVIIEIDEPDIDLIHFLCAHKYEGAGAAALNLFSVF